MNENRRLSLVVGSFVLLALGALAVALLSLSSQEGVWRDQYRLSALYDNVQGLLPNAPVWLAGTRVGRVESVELSQRLDGTPAVRVGMLVDRRVQNRIRGDSVSSIGTMGLLGDRYVEIAMGTETAAPLRDGGEINTVDPVGLNTVFERGSVALEGITELAANLNVVVEEFQINVGGEKLAVSLGAISSMMEEIETGDGLLHSLVYDQYEGGGVESIERSLVTFERILDEIADGEGVLHSLIYDRLTDQDVVLEAASAGAKLNDILGKMNDGEGTLGLLLNDPSLYEDIKQLVGGAQRSTLVRTMVRMSSDGED